MTGFVEKSGMSLTEGDVALNRLKGDFLNVFEAVAKHMTDQLFCLVDMVKHLIHLVLSRVPNSMGFRYGPKYQRSQKITK